MKNKFIHHLILLSASLLIFIATWIAVALVMFLLNEIVTTYSKSFVGWFSLLVAFVYNLIFTALNEKYN
jgi:hypothetical protein